MTTEQDKAVALAEKVEQLEKDTAWLANFIKENRKRINYEAGSPIDKRVRAIDAAMKVASK